MNQINGINPKTAQLLNSIQQGASDPSQVSDPNGFRNLLLDAIDHVNSMQQQADKAVESLVTGGDVNPAQVLTSMQKADMSFRMIQQIRNKLVQAYQEVKDIRI